MATEERPGRFLGIYSIGLGLAQIAATQGLARLIGIKSDGNGQMILRGIGLREIVTGVGLLRSPGSAGLLWARLAGDAMDLTFLGRAMTGHDSNRSRLTAAAMVVVATAAIDLLYAMSFSGKAPPGFGSKHRAVEVKKTITLGRSQEEVYSFWRDFENLPRFMRHLEAVQVTGDRRSHWTTKAPAGMKVEWDADIVEDRPNELISWRSIEGADVENWGTVRFMPAPGDRGTQVSVELYYNAPGGSVGAAIAKLFGEEPGQQVQEDLRVFKQVMETGQITLSEATARGTSFPQRPGQPIAGEAR